MNRRRLEISLGVLVIVTLAMLAYIAVKMGHLKGLGQTVKVTVIFDNAAGLVEDASIKIAGVQIGRVEDLKVDFNQAVATLLIDQAAQVRADALVKIRARSLLGEKYVEILPRSREAAVVVDGTVLSAAPQGLEIDELMAELGPLMKGVDPEKMGAVLSDLQALLADNREGVTQAVTRVNDLLARLQAIPFDDPQARDDVLTSLQNLREASEKLPALLEKADSTASELATRTGPLLERFDETLTTLEPTLKALPDTVEQLSSTLTSVSLMLERLEPVLARTDDLNYELVRKLLREEGLLIRFKESSLETPPPHLLSPSSAVDEKKPSEDLNAGH